MSNESISEELNSGLVAGVATHDGKECEGIPDSENKKKNKRKKKKKKKVETSDNDPHGCDAKAENTGPLPKSFENDNGEDGNKLHSSDEGTPIEEGEEVVQAPREASGSKKRKKKKKKKSKESETSMVYVEDLKPNNSLKQHTEKQDDTSPMDGSGVAKDDKRHFVETKRNEQGDEDNSQSLAEDNASLSERIESKDQDDDTASSIGEKTTSVPVPYKESEICTPKDGDEKGEAESERTMKPSSRASEELHVDGLAPLRDPSSVAVQVGGEGEEEIEDRGEKEEEEEKVESDSHGDPSDFPSGNEE